MNLEKWAVVKIESSNGLKIGIMQECDLGDEVEVIKNSLNETEADTKSKEFSQELNIPLFDSNEDEY